MYIYIPKTQKKILTMNIRIPYDNSNSKVLRIKTFFFELFKKDYFKYFQNYFYVLYNILDFYNKIIKISTYTIFESNITVINVWSFKDSNNFRFRGNNLRQNLM